ncbi:hypothetical protein T459_23364 [Capsicum annuum]|uniref:Uncharacterized protein n=1 Tax=Capsicum annuum TaxID=4072 RepID=A0A2G2YS64_CAPAN|nr:hypothetical protein T459_23364 [Capsicum annuum]
MEFSEQLMISESLKHDSEMVCMITLTMGIDKDIIYEDYDEHVQVLLEHTVHQVYESCWGVAWSELYLREIAGTMKLVKQIIDSEKCILVLDYYFIELTVINAHAERTIFLSQE